MKKRKFKVGDRVLVSMRRWDGTWHRKRGVIVRLWGKGPHAATVMEKDGPIRAAIDELRLVK